MADIVSNKTAEQLLHESLNTRIKAHEKLLPLYQEYIDTDALKLLDTAPILLPNVDAAITPNIAQYLATADKKDSSSLAQMGGGQLFLVLRIFRDLAYTGQDRKTRLLNGFRGQLIRAKTNKALGKAFV